MLQKDTEIGAVIFYLYISDGIHDKFLSFCYTEDIFNS